MFDSLSRDGLYKIVNGLGNLDLHANLLGRQLVNLKCPQIEILMYLKFSIPLTSLQM